MAKNKEQITIDIPKIKEKLNRLSDNDFLEFSEIYESELISEDLGSVNYSALDINGTVIKDCKIINSSFKLSSFTDVLFENCDFSTSTFENVSFLRVKFSRCKFTGTTFTKSAFYDTSFDGGIGELAAFVESKIKSAEIKDSNFTGLSFYSTQITTLLLKDNKLNKLEIENTLFKDVDFSSSEINGVRCNPQLLSGAKVSAAQTILIAKLLNIKVE